MTPTIEQQAIVDAALTGSDVSVQALAGCAKSSTLYLVAKAMPEKRMLYLAFNKAIATEASEKMPDNCECRTIHSIAYRNTPKQIVGKLYGKKPHSDTLINQLGIKAMMLIYNEDDEIFISQLRLLSWCRKTTLRYMQSSDVELSKNHIYIDPDYDTDTVRYGMEDIRSLVFEAAKKLWSIYIDPSSDMQIPHDVYLKLFGLSGKDLYFDVVLVDEKQDLSGVMSSILDSQKHSQKIYCGDSYQKIYSFTGSIDLQASSEAVHLTLSTSFRYGQGIADNAQFILDRLNCKQKLIGLGVPTVEDNKSIPDAIISRNNATVLQEYIKWQTLNPMMRINISCDTDQILSFAKGMVELEGGKSNHPMLRSFKSIAHLFSWINSTEEDIDPDMLRMANLCNAVSHHKIVRSLNTYRPHKTPDMVITTAHKSKGLEWDVVKLSTDFPVEMTADDVQEELRLLYVACTRARVTIQGFEPYRLKAVVPTEHVSS